jgi:hypothetical protein
MIACYRQWVWFSPASLFDGAHAGLRGEPMKVLGNVGKFGVFLFAGPWTNTKQVSEIALVFFWAVINGNDSVEVETKVLQLSESLMDTISSSSKSHQSVQRSADHTNCNHSGSSNRVSTTLVA